jgi:conjugal transfer/type IV secretion protein DotA/TraY
MNPTVSRRGARRLPWAPLLMVAGFLGTALSAYAQSSGSSLPPGVSVGGMTAAAGTSTDVASGFFRFLLGDFWDNPLSAVASGSTGLFGPLFAIYNGCIFVIGVLWATYGIGSAIVETAKSGQALGQRISTVWLPIRMVTGISGIIPVFGGFSLSQVVLVLMATLGIGMANLLTNAAVDATSSFNTVMSPSAAVGNSKNIDFAALAEHLFQVDVCLISYVKQGTDPAINYEPIGDEAMAFTGSSVASPAGAQSLDAYVAGTGVNPTACGGYTVQKLDPRANSSATGFRTSAVNYGAYAAHLGATAQQSADTALTQLRNDMQGIAIQWYQQRHLAGDSKSVPYPQAAINAAAASALALRSSTLQADIASQQQAADASGGGLQAAVVTQMKADGFAGIGAWYSTFAEAGAAFSSALDSVKVSPVEISAQAYMNEAVNEDLRSVAKARQEDKSQASSDDDSAFWDWFCHKTFGTVTGNCSIGQAIVAKTIDAGASGSGGGSSLVNPIMMSKNAGDYVLTMASTLTAVAAVVKYEGLDDGSSVKGTLLNVASYVPGLGIVAGVIQKAARLITGLAVFLPYMVILGLFLSIYIPMIPFITWLGGLTQYVVIFCQGIVGMPIAAFAHLDSEGEGLGRRTEAGYMFLLNVLFRPALMVFGFFMASGLIVIIGTFQAKLFVAGMANAQGNSVTGFYSVIGYLVLYAVLNITLIQSLFNMIFLLPDQILSLVGSHGSMAELGKDVEHRMNAMFFSTARSGQGAMAMIKPKSAGAGSKPGGGAEPKSGQKNRSTEID